MLRLWWFNCWIAWQGSWPATMWQDNVTRLFAPAEASYGEAAGTLTLPCRRNSGFLLHHHDPRASSSKSCRGWMWTMTWSLERTVLIGLWRGSMPNGRCLFFAWSPGSIPHSHQPPDGVFGSCSYEMKPRSQLSLLFLPLYLYYCNACRKKKK